jgi:hypothetical protein
MPAHIPNLKSGPPWEWLSPQHSVSPGGICCLTVPTGELNLPTCFAAPPRNTFPAAPLSEYGTSIEAEGFDAAEQRQGCSGAEHRNK